MPNGNLMKFDLQGRAIPPCAAEPCPSATPSYPFNTPWIRGNSSFTKVRYGSPIAAKNFRRKIV